MADLSELTITIPTYNRPEHLRRLLTYYQRVGTQTRFLVLDSSGKDIVAENAALVASCGARFQHIVFPSSLPVATKLFQGIALVETPYCAFCADDDLIFPDALAHALDFLANHPDYACADGIYLNFRLRNGKIEIQAEYSSRGIEANHPGARVFRLFQQYESMFYGVFRTRDLQDIFSFVKDIPSLHYQELFQAVGALIKGKSHRLPEFYAARQHCDAAEPTRDRWHTMYWFADDNEEFLSHYRDYRGNLWRFYENFGAKPHMDKPTFNSAMDMAHATFFSKSCSPQFFHSRLQQYWPTDAFKAANDQDCVYDDLRRERRLTWEKLLYALMKGFEFKAARYAPSVAQRCLKKETKLLEKDSLGWGCHLYPNIWWFASVPKFRKTFLDLCRYLGNAKQ